MIRSLLIANRGEIACRIIRTARRLGIRTVAVYSDADARALHVREADEAVHIGPSPARESYLVGDKIIAAAKTTGAEAIHPGYGFLSENAAFAQAVIDAGLVWVGPDPASITAMGLKDAAKKLMDEAGVPTTPGYLGEDQDPERLHKEADAIGYPVLIKAVAGGGGKGMRRVDDTAEFAEMLASCRREAAASFGDDRVLIEKYIERPRHIEVQVFGDKHGNVVHLFERDCSLQRRHQKVIEEAPAPGMDEATRAAVCAAAVKAAKAVDYVGAGTIEFIADASEGLRADRIWFMEMNTRLQVEHPVTEEITGQDLVEWQLRVASGEPLPKRQDELAINGWAMEARLYAEDPTREFLPSVGAVDVFDVADLHDPTARALRVDTGIAPGIPVSPYYDPMVGKLIVLRETRAEAADALANHLEFAMIWPLRTNAGFLWQALRHPDFVEGEVDTGFIARHVEELTKIEPVSDESLSRTVLMAQRYYGGGISRMFSSPWQIGTGFRLNAPSTTVVKLSVDGAPVDADPFKLSKIVIGAPKGATTGHLLSYDDGVLVTEKGITRYVTEYRPHGAVGGVAAGDGAIVSPMPGKIIALEVAAGDTVTKGQKLLTLEAMKMEHSLTAPFDGIVAELNAVAGGQVSEGTLLARIEKQEG